MQNLINELEDKIKGLIERLEDVEKWRKGIKILADQSKKPHKCPVCDFTGAIELERMDEISRFSSNEIMKTDDGRYFIFCRSCEGKGIVWG